MTKRMRLYQILACLLLLALTIWIESFTNFDMWVQNLFYDKLTGEWWISKAEHAKYRWIFYGGAKKVISIFAGICGGVLLLGFLSKKRHYLIRPGLIILLSLALIPLTSSTGKKYTNIYCPYNLVEFGGDIFYQHVLECPRPENAGKKPGRCFPAAHASGGFALMALYFCLPRQKWLGLGIGLTAGWIMGNYQMLRGDHFLTHTITTMLLAWLLILLIVDAVDRFMGWFEIRGTGGKKQVPVKHKAAI